MLLCLSCDDGVNQTFWFRVISKFNTEYFFMLYKAVIPSKNGKLTQVTNNVTMMLNMIAFDIFSFLFVSKKLN